MNNEKMRFTIEMTGIAAVVVSLYFVWAELNQTRNSMEAASLAARNERSSEISMLSYELGLVEINRKISSGVQLSDDENARVRVFANSLMWHLETIHFEYTQGLVDDELWEANLNSLRMASTSAWFPYVYPNWGPGTGSAAFRESYIELVSSILE